MEIERILDRLITAEMREPNAHWRSDYRQSRICIGLAARGSPQPFVEASYKIHGVHPDLVFPTWLEEQQNKLGDEFNMWYSEDGVLLPDVGLKKPPEREAEVYPRLAELIGFRGAK